MVVYSLFTYNLHPDALGNTCDGGVFLDFLITSTLTHWGIPVMVVYTLITYNLHPDTLRNTCDGGVYLDYL